MSMMFALIIFVALAVAGAAAGMKLYVRPKEAMERVTAGAQSPDRMPSHPSLAMHELVKRIGKIAVATPQDKALDTLLPIITRMSRPISTSKLHLRSSMWNCPCLLSSLSWLFRYSMASSLKFLRSGMRMKFFKIAGESEGILDTLIGSRIILTGFVFTS